MDALGQRMVRDQDEIRDKREAADVYERKAAQLRREADEIERLLDQARFAQRARRIQADAVRLRREAGESQ